MNPIQKAVDDIKFRIPRPILEKVFVRRGFDWKNPNVNVDNQIINNVIRPRALVDCNLVGGIQAIVSLMGLPREQTNQFTYVYRVPKERTQGRSIISVLNVTYGDPNYADNSGAMIGSGNLGSSPLLNVAEAILNSQSPAPVVSTAHVQLIGENVVMIRDSAQLPGILYLRCTIANEEYLSNLKLRSYPNFSKLCEYAVKAYIYNEYIIEMDQGELMGGHQLGSFKQIIEGYADAEELYQTYLREKMQKILMMSDTESYNRYLKTMIGIQR